MRQLALDEEKKKASGGAQIGPGMFGTLSLRRAVSSGAPLLESGRVRPSLSPQATPKVKRGSQGQRMSLHLAIPKGMSC